jgi:hypothetical protein
MTNASPTDTSNKSLTRDLLYAAQYYLGRRRVLLFLAAIVIGGGLALKWDWLVAAGIAPILIALLPCAVMCALGMCMHKKSGDAAGAGGCCATDASPPSQAEAQSGNKTTSIAGPSANRSALGCCQEAANPIAPASTEKAQTMDKTGIPRA